MTIREAEASTMPVMECFVSAEPSNARSDEEGTRSQVV